MRRQHYLRANKGCEMPSECIWVDTETKPSTQPDGSEAHHLWFGYAAHRRAPRPNEWTKPDWTRFIDIGEYWDWVESKLHGKIKLYMFAHNWAFDGPVLDVFNELPRRGWKLVGSVIQSPPIILRYRRGCHTLQLVDTLNIWRMKLEDLGNSLELPKLTMPALSDPQSQWDTYGQRDVEIIMLACLQWWTFLKSNDLGGFASTLAAQAFRTFRHRFMHHDILIDDNENSLELSRQALHGGRTECAFIGKVPHRVFKLDINSQYASVMHNEYMPRKVIGHYRSVTFSELRNWLTKYCVVAECTVDTEQAVYPLVHDKRLIFPVGQFTTFLTTPEISYGLEHGHIIGIRQAAVYERDILFKDYVEWMFDYRVSCKDQGNEVDADNAKILLVALFGKFGQRGFIYNTIEHIQDLSIGMWTELDAETGEVNHLRQYGGIIEQLINETEARDSSPAIAAHITAHGRMMLWSLLQQAGKGNVVYYDTDSIWTNETGYSNLKEHCHKTDLGKLKMEGIHNEVIIYGPKDYRLDGLARIKGIRRNAVEIDPGYYRQEKFTSLKGLLRIGDLTRPIVTTITKRLQRIYKKGIVTPTGVVDPLRFPLKNR